MADKVSQISKAVDEVQLYSYQYSVKKVGVPQVEGTSESATSSETKGQIVGTRKSLNGRKNIWHEEK